MQGATDIDVACCLFKCAGAFAASPIAGAVVLVAGDADFRPALEAILEGRGQQSDALQTIIAAESIQLGRAYKTWIQATDGAHHLELGPLLGGVARNAGLGVVDLRGPLRPMDGKTGRADVSAIVRECEDMAKAAGSSTTFTLNLSGRAGAPWGDEETAALCVQLAASQCAASLEQLWLHHLPIGDSSCVAIGRLMAATPKLLQLHLSDSNVTLAGLKIVVEAARDVGFGQRFSPQRDRDVGERPKSSTSTCVTSAVVRLSEWRRTRPTAAWCVSSTRLALGIASLVLVSSVAAAAAAAVVAAGGAACRLTARVGRGWKG